MDGQVQSKRPKSSAFRQQRLAAWQPILTAGTVLPTFFLVGLAFIPIGILLFLSSESVNEAQIDYTDCQMVGARNNITCREVLEQHLSNRSGMYECICHETLMLEDDFLPHVFVYYGLSNFYQNHRRYVKSRSDKQLLGTPGYTTQDCAPFDRDDDGKPIAPCGAIANSLFNDTIKLSMKDGSGSFKPVELLRSDISWLTDRTVKFRNASSYAGTAKPPAWKHDIATIGGFINEDLIVWMRTAALPTFRKLYARINHDLEDWKYKLPKGEYRVEITYNYPVHKFKGTKRIIISNTSWLGGKNPFLGIAYMVVGGVCLVLGAVFLFIHHRFGKNQRLEILQKYGMDLQLDQATAPQESSGHNSSTICRRNDRDSQTVGLVGHDHVDNNSRLDSTQSSTLQANASLPEGCSSRL